MSDGRIGTVIAGRYKVEELIAKRPVAEVYRGTDTVGKRAVAIKILGDGSDVVRKRFLREAQAMVGLSHPNIVAVYGSGEDHEQSYIVSEPAFGKPLTAAREGMSIERGIETFIHVLEAIEYAHAQHIVHRDIKPENIVVLDDGTVKVMDFGLSRRFVDVAPGVSETGEIASAIAYLPPERFLGKPTD
ncbi:MAG: serine/threonine protein kinase, partial [Candidatus Eremiobacteraeota bacterium]|nr:serine/threonine protein kinase [Candidatus Eremiobacteraeota bacterium]